MKHRVDKSKLKPTASHTKAALSNLATALIRHERIKTTITKAKALRRFIEPMITRAKVDSLHNKRQILRKLKDRFIMKKLFEKLGVRYQNRPGGYTRIFQLNKAKVGDASRMALIELVEEYMPKSSDKKNQKPLEEINIEKKS